MLSFFCSSLTGDRFQGLSVKTETGETKRVWEGSRSSAPHMHGWLAYSDPPRLWHDLHHQHVIVHFLTNLHRNPRWGPQSKRLGWYRILLTEACRHIPWSPNYNGELIQVILMRCYYVIWQPYQLFDCQSSVASSKSPCGYLPRR